MIDLVGLAPPHKVRPAEGERVHAGTEDDVLPHAWLERPLERILGIAGTHEHAHAGRHQRIQNESDEASSGATRWQRTGSSSHGGYSGHMHSLLGQIDRSDVGSLRVEWIFQERISEQFEATHLVHHGILCITVPPGDVYALDAETGARLWRCSRRLPGKLIACCGLVNRGFAILGNRLFMATMDADAIALDRKAGRPAAGVGDDRLLARSLRHARAARCQGYGDSRQGRRRIRDPWVHRRARCAPEALQAAHDPLIGRGSEKAVFCKGLRSVPFRGRSCAQVSRLTIVRTAAVGPQPRAGASLHAGEPWETLPARR